MPKITPPHPRTNIVRQQKTNWGCFVCSTLAVVEFYLGNTIAVEEEAWATFYKIHDPERRGGSTSKALALTGHYNGTVDVGPSIVQTFNESIKAELDSNRPVLADVAWRSAVHGRVGHALYIYGYDVLAGVPGGTYSLNVADPNPGYHNAVWPAEQITDVAIQHGGNGAYISRFHLTKPL